MVQTKNERHMNVDGHNIELSSMDKVLFPEKNITKAGLIDYYSNIAPYMVALVQDRPVSLQRFPSGIGKKGFFQKEIPDYFPDFVKRVKIEYSDAEDKTQLCVNNRATLIYLANSTAIIIHNWLSCVGHLRRPDRLVFDLDPSEEGEWPKMVKAAKCLKALCEELKLKPYVMTTGSKGMHIVIPIEAEQTFKELKPFLKQLQEILVKRWPKDLTLEFMKKKRKGRILVDIWRNSYGQTAVAPYSVRKMQNATVAAPVSWEELEEKNMHPQRYTIHNMLERLKQQGNPWEDIDQYKGSVEKAQQLLDEMEKPEENC